MTHEAKNNLETHLLLLKRICFALFLLQRQLESQEMVPETQVGEAKKKVGKDKSSAWELGASNSCSAEPSETLDIERGRLFIG